MNQWLTSIGPAVADHLWQSTIFAVVAALLTVLLKKNQARIRYWIWLAALVKFVVPFSLLIGLGGLLPTPQHAPAATPTASAAMDTISQPFVVEALPNAPLHIVKSKQHRAPEVMTSMWLYGLVVVLVMWRMRWRRVAAVVREATVADTGREVEVLRRLEREAGTRPVHLLLSRSSMEPGIFGIVRPVLLWPERISARLSEAQVEAILAHELCHVRRRDNLFATAQMAVQTIFWFYPLVWWMGARMVEERERACDEEVLEQGRSAETYAESILKICEFCLESPLACVSGITGADLKRRIVQIMSRHLAKKLSLGKRAILATAALIAIAGPLAFGLIQMIPMHVQILHATGPLPSYEVATIKPDDDRRIERDVPANGERFNGTVKDLVESAYNIPYGADERVIGGPGWITGNHYVIESRIPDDLFARMQTMSGPEKRQQNDLMEQSLLTDRFKLKVHFEMRQMPVYALAVKRGSKAKPAKADPNTPPVPRSSYYANTFGPNSGLTVSHSAQGALEMTAKAVSMDHMGQSLEEVVKELGGRTIVNRTGLDGPYDFKLTWTPQQMTNTQNEDGAAAESNAPSIFTALEEQLGLKLVPAKGMIEVVVIDSIELPSAN